MSVCKDYIAEVLELAREYCAVTGQEATGEMLESIQALWSRFAERTGGDILAEARNFIAEFNYTTPIDLEASTCLERRRLYGRSRDDLDLDEHEEELRWLQSRTNESNEELYAGIVEYAEGVSRLKRLQEDIEYLESECSVEAYEFAQELKYEVQELDRALDLAYYEMEQVVIREKQRLENRLYLISLQKRKQLVNKATAVLSKTVFSRRALARSRAPRSARRASFSAASASSGGDSGESDPPRPHPHHSLVTPHSNRKHSNRKHPNRKHPNRKHPNRKHPNRKHSQNALNPWLVLGSCCVSSEGGWAA